MTNDDAKAKFIAHAMEHFSDDKIREMVDGALSKETLLQCIDELVAELVKRGDSVDQIAAYASAAYNRATSGAAPPASGDGG